MSQNNIRRSKRDGEENNVGADFYSREIVAITIDWDIVKK